MFSNYIICCKRGPNPFDKTLTVRHLGRYRSECWRGMLPIFVCIRSKYHGKTLRLFWLPKTNSQLHLAFVEWLRQYFIQRQLPRIFNIDILCNMIRQCWISFAITQFLTSIQVNHVQLWRHNYKWVHLQLISKTSALI